MIQLPLQVSVERWHQAQEWESAHWCAQHPAQNVMPVGRLKRLVMKMLGLVPQHPPPVELGDDWNHWWSEQFGQYEELPTAFENVVELGCGPYTNMRVILERRSAMHVYGSDPLIRKYIKFDGQWLAEMWKAGNIFIDDHPLEDCPFAANYFDLTVLINVLDHCRDSLACLKQVVRITKPGGYVVVGQDLSDVEDVNRTGDDIGHPIRIDHHILDQELLSRCEPIRYKVLDRNAGRNPEAHYGTYIFIGRKRASLT